MMAYSEDHIALAAEYALGTLDANERAQAETMMSVDPGFTAIVDAWERKLGVLNQMVGSMEPRAEVWDKIRSAIGLSQPQMPMMLPEQAAAPVVESESMRAATQSNVTDSNVIAFSPQARRWRGVATGAGAMAAALLALLAVQVTRPDLLPESLRQKPQVQVATIEKPVPAAASGQYVAVLQKDGGAPAFILTVNAATKDFTVRKVDAQAEPGKSYELWLISDKLPQPRSLGVIGDKDFTARPILASYDTDTVNGATYAVTVEQQGGSPSGKPTSTPVYTGKLIETVPATR